MATRAELPREAKEGRPLRTYIHLLIIAAVGLLAYSNTLHVPFVFDGKAQILNNPMIKDLNNFRLVFEGRHFSRAAGYVYVPSRLVGYLSFALNYYFGRLDVVGYHITNLAVHIFSAVLVYFFVLLTFRTPAMSMPADPAPAETTSRAAGLLALFTALLFVSHPVQTEAVTYIVQRFASLATMFYLLSVVAYVKGRLLTEGRGVMGKGLWGKDEGLRPLPVTHYLRPITFFCLSFVSAVLAMRTKEISFTLPIVIVIYEFLFFPAPLRKRLAFLAPALLTLAVIPLTLIGVNKPLSQILSDVTAKTRLGTNIPRADYLLTQMRVVTTYIRLLFFPAGQNVDYEYPVYHSLLSLPVLFSFIFLSAIFATAVYMLFRSRQASKPAGLQARKNEGQSQANHNSQFTIHYSRLIAFGILWFFVTLSVTSSVIPIADVIFEHRLYLPSAGAFLAIAATGFALAGRLDLSARKGERWIIAVVGAVVLILSAATYSRNAVWASGISLWGDAAAKSPDKIRPLDNLGREYVKAGRFGDAKDLFRKALEADPAYAKDYYSNIGFVDMKTNRLEAAEEAFNKELKIDPRSGSAYSNLCFIYTKQGRYDDAQRACNEAIEIAPDSAYKAYNNLSVLYRTLGRTEDAGRAAGRAIRLNPDFPLSYNNLGLLYAKENKTDAAEADFRQAVSLDPGYTEAYSNLGALYIVTRRPEEAVRVLEKALKTDDPLYPGLHLNLGVARYLSGDYRGAMEEYGVLRGIDPGQAEKLLAVINGMKKG